MTAATPAPLKAPPRITPRATPITTPSVPLVNLPKIGRIEPTRHPWRIVLNAVEGWGKTTAGAYTDNPVILMTGGETGYQTLLAQGRVPQADGAIVESWPQMLAIVDRLCIDERGYGTLVIDAIGGLDRYAQEFICNRDFKGEWGEKGFGAYQKGFELSAGEWLNLLNKLDRLRSEKGTNVLMISHVETAGFKNPLGPDFDRFTSTVHKKAWPAIAKWADAVLFGNFETVVEGGTTGTKARKGKGIGGSERVLYCERRDAWDAKNRYGMPEAISVPADPSQVWPTIAQYLNQQPAAE